MACPVLPCGSLGNRSSQLLRQEHSSSQEAADEGLGWGHGHHGKAQELTAPAEAEAEAG